MKTFPAALLLLVSGCAIESLDGPKFGGQSAVSPRRHPVDYRSKDVPLPGSNSSAKEICEDRRCEKALCYSDHVDTICLLGDTGDVLEVQLWRVAPRAVGPRAVSQVEVPNGEPDITLTVTAFSACPDTMTPKFLLAQLRGRGSNIAAHCRDERLQCNRQGCGLTGYAKGPRALF